ncbi:hypothetical protein [Fundidesulfovibrio butyratiphilus]
MQGEYETRDGSTLRVDFTGIIADALLVKDFLDPQLRATDEKTWKSNFP